MVDHREIQRSCRMDGMKRDIHKLVNLIEKIYAQNWQYMKPELTDEIESVIGVDKIIELKESPDA